MNEKRQRMVIDMQNPNALISMAYVSQNSDNPYYCFCEYIKYSIYSSNDDGFTLKEVTDMIKANFGIYLPFNVTKTCLSIICNEKFIVQEYHKVYKSKTYDTNSFESVRLEFLKTEEELLSDLKSFALKYNRVWTSDYTRDLLIKILNYNGMAFEIFMDGSSDTMQILSQEEKSEKSEELFSDEYIVGVFIEKTLSSESTIKEYLVKICEGLMICIGTYQLPVKDSRPVLPIIKNTAFIFDTRLIMRLLGCADKTAIEAINELVDLIRQGEGKMYYYPHTLEEVIGGFDDAITALETNEVVRDREMRMFLSTIHYNPSVLKAKKANVENELAELGVYLKPLNDYSEKDRLKYGFDLQSITDYMYSNLTWEKRTIQNDARSIWETHMMREGKYNDYCGGNSHSAVFVTSNYRLIEMALKYKADNQHIKTIEQWKRNRLPVITDSKLTCRLWIPSDHAKDISILILAKNAIAAQKPSRCFIESMKRTVKQLSENVPEYAKISLPSYFEDNITHAVFETTKGEFNEFNMETLANSIDEIVALKSIEDEEEKKKLTEERDAFKRDYTEKEQKIIDGAVSFFVDKFKLKKLELRIIKNLDFILSFLFSIISLILALVFQNSTLWIGVFCHGC